MMHLIKFSTQLQFWSHRILPPLCRLSFTKIRKTGITHIQNRKTPIHIDKSLTRRLTFCPETKNFPKRETFHQHVCGLSQCPLRFGQWLYVISQVLSEAIVRGIVISLYGRLHAIMHPNEIFFIVSLCKLIRRHRTQSTLSYEELQWNGFISYIK